MGSDPSFLTSKSVVFFFHQGYTFAYFFADTDENPAIWWYREDEPIPNRSNETFIDMLKSQIALMEQNHRAIMEAGGYFVTLTDQGVRETYPARADGIRPLDCEDQFIDT